MGDTDKRIYNSLFPAIDTWLRPRCPSLEEEGNNDRRILPDSLNKRSTICKNMKAS